VGRYLVGRLVQLLPTVLGVTFVVFVSIQLIPGDPAREIAGQDATDAEVAALRRQLGLDRPLHEQYLRYLGRLARGDLGRSLGTSQPVSAEIAERLPATLALAAASMVVASAVGLLAGIVSGVRPNTWLDGVFTVIGSLGISMPVFWTGLVLILIFAEYLRWLPSGGTGSLAHLVLPALTLGLWGAADIARLTRATVIELLGEDFVRTAWAKGVAEPRVILRHLLPNGMLPIVTILGLQVSTFLSGTVLTETVFSYPGLGRFMVSAISIRDIPMVQGGVLVIALMFVLTNLLVDVLYAFLDPRVRVG
jgi:ABC-type dipeptide/oligopeptide/nickel transport system permease component